MLEATTSNGCVGLADRSPIDDKSFHPAANGFLVFATYGGHFRGHFCVVLVLG